MGGKTRGWHGRAVLVLHRLCPGVPTGELGAHNPSLSDRAVGHQSKPLAKGCLEACVEKYIHFLVLHLTNERIWLGQVFWKAKLWLTRWTVDVLLEIGTEHFHVCLCIFILSLAGP